MPPTLPPSMQVDVLPLDDPQWGWRQFERFCLGLVRALPDVADANLYGTSGEAQGGIDIEAQLRDGRTRTYQCRKRRRHTRRDAEKLVADTTKEADEHVILVTCEVGTAVRTYIAGLDGWSVLDKEDISRRVRELEPRERARRLVQDAFSIYWRRAFLGPQGPLAFSETEDYFRPALDEARLFRHTWTLVGRDALLQDIDAKLADPGVRILVIPGRGGIGKSRLLRAVGERCAASRTVLFADDEVDLTAEAVEELPWVAPLVIVDDAHRRDDLGPLTALAAGGGDGPTVILSTRPHRLEELRSLFSRNGLSTNEVWVAEPMTDLDEQDVESLARQALGDEYAQHAERLAWATRDCPLVTVIGGQLLAQRLVTPELLEREEDFRSVVLERFRDEMLGRLGDHVDAAAAREALVVLAALGPVSVEDEATMGRVAEELGLQLPALRLLFSELEESGIVIARGRLRRIVPDVLADHILHGACVDRQGRPTGRSDALLARYGDVALGSLLRNLAELDWRIGLTTGDAELLAAFWHEVQAEFSAGDAQQRVNIVRLVTPIAALAPEPVLELVRAALANPATTAQSWFAGYNLTDESVRQALPRVLGRIGLTHRFLGEVLVLLWELARDDDRPPAQHTEHALRILEELSSYELPLVYPEATLDLVERLIGDEAEMSTRKNSPLQLLKPLLEREGTTTRAAGLQIRLGSYHVDAASTAAIRSRVRNILVREATGGTLRNRVLAARLLGEAMAEPRGFDARAVPEAATEQWHDDQIALLDAAHRVMTGTDDPHVRFEVRSRTEWHVEHSHWEDAKRLAREICELDHSERERLVAFLRNPWDFRDPDAARARMDAFAQTLADGAEDASQLAERIDAEVRELDTLPGRVTNSPSQLLWAVARARPALGAALASWCLSNPGRRLADFGTSLSAGAGSSSTEQTRELLRGLRGGDVRARRQLADHLSGGTWFDDPGGVEGEMLSELVADEDPGVVAISLTTVLRLAELNPRAAITAALTANIGTDARLAEDLCMAVSRVTSHFESDEVDVLLSKLLPVATLEYFAHEVLSGLSSVYPSRIMQFLLDRAATGGGVHVVSFHDYNVDLLRGAAGEERLELLRQVRDSAIGAEVRLCLELAVLYWRLAGDLDAGLSVLREWLVEGSSEQFEAGIWFARSAPADAALERREFVAEALEAAEARGPESLSRLSDALSYATALSVPPSRTIGHPADRDLLLRDRGRELAHEASDRSPARTFYERVATRGEDNIAQAALEDEELSER